MSDVTVRLARPEDAKTIADFNQKMAMETEGKSLPEETIQAGVSNLFKRPEMGFYVVAESAGQVVACLMITHEWSDWRNGLFWWIQSVYVDSDYRRLGIYRRMYEFVKAEAQNHPDVWGFRLYVELENTRAQATYESLGMERCHYHMYEAMK